MILVIDDDYSVTTSLTLLLKQAGYSSASVATPEEALERLARGDVDLVLQDMNFTRKTTGEEGLALLGRIRARDPDLPVILMTAWGSIELAVEGIKAGAKDFITKPWSNDQILHAVGTALGLRERGSAADARGITRQELEGRYDLTGVVGESAPFLQALSIAAKVSGTDASILVTGESGTGKEVLAEFVHRNSPRCQGPFVKVNLGGVGSNLFESEMFGHVRGAFTDAHRDRAGRFAAAEGGSILLDEIAELEPACQVKMLRVLQDRTYEVLGSNEPRSMNVRVISATNCDLKKAVDEGEFREDLFYRLNLITVHLPNLGERCDDIPVLARHFVTMAKETYSRPDFTIGADALVWLSKRKWPGNIRQLGHLLERAVLVTEGPVISVRDLEHTLAMESSQSEESWVPPVGSMTMEEMEKAMILRSVEHHRGNLTRVAESLGLSRAALYRRLEKFGIRT
jgi:DNA-binding NtrC family response regulator